MIYSQLFYIVFINIIVNKTEHVCATLRLSCLFQEYIDTVRALQFDSFQVISGGDDKTIISHDFFETAKPLESGIIEPITEEHKGTPPATTTGKIKMSINN